MSINLYKKKTINNQPVLEELLSKSTDTVDNKPLVYDSTTDNVKSADDLCVNTVTANCFCGKATCADIADVACTVCVNGTTGPLPILTVDSDGKVHNTGNCTLAGRCCIITPLVATNYIFADGSHNDLTLISSKYCEEYGGPSRYSCVFYDPFSIQSVQCDVECGHEVRFQSGYLQGAYNSQPGLWMCFRENYSTTSSCFLLNKDCTCYHRADYNNNNDVYNDIIMTCTGEISISTCMCPTNSITGKSCLDLGICGNILYSKSCLNNQYNYLIQDCNGTCICACRSGSTYCPATLQICFNGIRTNSKNSIAESYLSEKPNSFMLHTCDTTNCKTGSIEVDSDSGYILHCTCNGNCGRVGFSQNGVTFIQNNVSSTIIGDQFSGNAATATNAVNSTCFNNCTYSEACIDIRDGLATQACANAIQNCADFIQNCVSSIESKIPAQASASNQLADKDFVNSSITTNTANFRGTYACVTDLPSTGNTNNDYAFVCSLNTTTGNYIYDRYKWVASDSCWVCEYELNTTGFTAEQLASINSGITSNLVAKITDVYDNTVTVCMNGECKGSFNLNQNTDVCIDLGDTIRNACCADYATSAAQASSATNATCFDGCTYAQAKTDIRNYTPSLATNATCFDGCTYAQAKTDIRNYTPSLATNATCFDGCTYAQAKTDIRNYTPSLATNATCFDGCTYAQAKTDIRNYTPSLATNATCFGGCTYAQACTNIRSGLTSCTGTVTSVNVSVNGCSGTAVTTSGTVTLTNVPTCRIYKTMATASCNRNVLLGEVTEAAGYGCVYVGNCCKLTFNPATGVLCAKCFCGSVTASGQIDCAKAIKRYQATTGDCHIALFNGTTAIDNACTYVSSSCPLTYNPGTGLLCATELCSEYTCTTELRVHGQALFGNQCDICIYDICGNPFICAWGNTLIMGYCSEYAVDCNCSRITIGLNNHICIGTNCGNSVVVGYDNCVCWPTDSNLSFIYGRYNTTVDGGLAVGGWNKSCGGCSIALGWDNIAGECGIAIGEGVCAKGLESIAIGCNATASCIYSIAIGTDSVANGIDRLAIGRFSATNAYGTACVNSNIKKGPLREITVTWCDSTLKCDIWKAIACNIDLRRNGKNSIITSGCTYLSATGYIGNDQIPLYACNYNYNSSLATMCSIVIRTKDACNIMTLSATCTAAATDAAGGGFLTVTGWAR